jgi:hypothetical protein
MIRLTAELSLAIQPSQVRSRFVDGAFSVIILKSAVVGNSEQRSLTIFYCKRFCIEFCDFGLREVLGAWSYWREWLVAGERRLAAGSADSLWDGELSELIRLNLFERSFD